MAGPSSEPRLAKPMPLPLLLIWNTCRGSGGVATALVTTAAVGDLLVAVAPTVPRIHFFPEGANTYNSYPSCTHDLLEVTLMVSPPRLASPAA